LTAIKLMERGWPKSVVLPGDPASSQGDTIMCDYSLEHVTSRAAVVADRLIVTSFQNTITRGFAATGDLNTAVCLRPGTEIAFEREPRYEHPITHWQKTAPGKVARFRQIEMHVRHTHHDALEFADGTIVPLSRLIPGQWATVLQLPSVPLHVVDEAPASAGEMVEQSADTIR
jgi:hypothetical protein